MIAETISPTHPNVSPIHGEEDNADPRWQLIDRILGTAPFQKSHRLPALLRYLTKHSVDGTINQLTEQRIGASVFGKSANYSPAEDSSVRVHVRQLRLRLHEYFACEGRGEAMVAGIPKGSYELTFHAIQAPMLVENTIEASEPAQPRHRTWKREAFTWIAMTAALVCAAGWYHTVLTSRDAGLQWPVSAVVQRDRPTKVVVSDGRTMLRLVAQKQFSLNDYLEPGFPKSMLPAKRDEGVTRLVNYLTDSQTTSYADTLVASTLVKLAGIHGKNLTIYTARDLNRRDLEDGNFVFVGGPTSNPWVSLFADELNFRAVEDGVGGRMYFLNKKPLPGEQATYEALPYTGSGGEDYGTISLLPNGSGTGNILILQGLREEGTEALAILLADEKDRAEMLHALKMRAGKRDPVYFEALVRTRTVAGAPVSISIVTSRILSP